MFLDWAMNSTGSKYLSGFALVVTLLMTVATAAGLILDFYLGVPLDIKDLGSLAFSASFFPLIFGSLSRFKKKRENDRDPDPHLDRVYEESIDDRNLNMCILWSIGIGALIHDLASGPDAGSLLPDLFAPLALILIFCFGLFAYSRPPYRLALSPVGINFSKIKAGPISWQDVANVNIRKHFWANHVTITLKDPKKYRVRRPSVTVSPLILKSSLEEIFHAIECRRAVFGTDSDTIDLMHDLPPLGQMT